jgi:hypothetical protein
LRGENERERTNCLRDLAKKKKFEGKFTFLPPYMEIGIWKLEKDEKKR